MLKTLIVTSALLWTNHVFGTHVKVNLKEGPLEYEIGKTFLKVIKRPSRGTITDGELEYKPGSGPIILVGPETSYFELVFPDQRTGKNRGSINLAVLAQTQVQQQKLKRLSKYRMSWDTSETGFQKHLELLRKVDEVDRLDLLKLWMGGDLLSLHQWGKLLEAFKDNDEKMEAATILGGRIKDLGDYSANALLQVLGDAQGRSQAAKKFLLNLGKLTLPETIEYCDGLVGVELAQTLPKLVPEDAAEIPHERKLAWLENMRHTHFRSKMSAISTLFSKKEHADLLDCFGVNEKKKAAQALFGARDDLPAGLILQILRKFDDAGERVEVLLVLERSFPNLSDREVEAILADLDPEAKITAVAALVLKYPLSWELAVKVFGSVAKDDDKFKFIKAGLFDHAGMTPERMETLMKGATWDQRELFFLGFNDRHVSTHRKPVIPAQQPGSLARL